MIKFKKGDYVVVVSGRYPITGNGSHGRITKRYGDICKIRFEFINTVGKLPKGSVFQVYAKDIVLSQKHLLNRFYDKVQKG